MKNISKLNKILPTYKRKIYAFISIAICLTSFSCKKLVEVNPPKTQIASAAIYDNNASATAAMTGIYVDMLTNGGAISDGNSSIGFQQALAADELTNYNTSLVYYSQFYQNKLSSSINGASTYYYWKEIYNKLHVLNSILEGLSNFSGVTTPIKNQLNGEAKFMRAFFHFYAINLYGDVPMITTSNYLVNDQIARTPASQVYDLIIQDLKDAQHLLTDDYLDATGAITTEKIRPNKAAATALLAKVYLYRKDWADAANEASGVIGGSYTLNTDLSQVFESNSTETIWQLRPVSIYNTLDATFYILTSAPGGEHTPAAINPFLLSAFENGDQRLTNWINSITTGGKTYYYPAKYKVRLSNQPITEYKMVFRLAEIYLIRSEAEANGATGGLDAAITDLNIIRHRAGLPDYSGAATQTAVLAAIMHERQVELFTEWGNRWFDLIRTGNINSVMGSPGNVSIAKGSTWDPNYALLPLPLGDLQIDPNLKQNPGY
jgi:hypothetical protein